MNTDKGLEDFLKTVGGMSSEQIDNLTPDVLLTLVGITRVDSSEEDETED